jgi:hypothetical protein
MRAWICLTPVRLSFSGWKLATPPESVALLGVFRTKKSGREVCGPKAAFLEVEWPVEKGTKP